MVWLLRFILLCFMMFLIYMGVKVFFNPYRKLESARRQKEFLLIDHKDIRKNFHLTYKGVIYAGEKYSSESREVVSVFIHPQKVSSLAQLNKDDFMTIEEHIQKKYPHATITWGYPVNAYLKKHK